jgi:polyphosphate kinase
LEFNRRVLDEALDQNVPLLERVKFLAIFSSNLDEFFMVRVGGLKALVEAGRTKKDPSGLTPTQQLAAIAERTGVLVDEQMDCFLRDVEPALRRAEIRIQKASDITPEQHRYLERFFGEQIFPVMTPMAIDPEIPFPLLRNLTLYLAIRLKPDQGTRTPRFTMIPIQPGFDRFLRLPSRQGVDLILLEDVVRLFVRQFFPGQTVMECCVFRITRNADMSVQEDQAPDLLSGMQDVLSARKTSDCVRLEVEDSATRIMSGFLRKSFRIKEEHIYRIRGPVDLRALFSLSELEGSDALRCEPWPPQPVPGLESAETMFETLARRDLLLCHPYDSFDSVVRLVEEAAEDPQVMAVKQILYRTSRDSPIVQALMRGAERGKYVTAIVELKARFDESRNIEWARALEESGVQVIYGIKGLKTHAKLCIILRREAAGIRRYIHVGTGNYNETTARLYSDISYLTANEDLCAEASVFFNMITGYSQPQRFRSIAAAPLGLRDLLLELIEGEIERTRQNQKARITLKMNSLVDPVLIDALYRASQAGVRIRINVRGICCLRPGVPGLSDQIEVRSIVDRFLEHARIYWFRHGGDDRVYISSADLMPRNLDGRIELLVPVQDSDAKKRLLNILGTYFQDNVKARILQPDGVFHRAQAPGRRKRVRAQETLYREICRAVEDARKGPLQAFEPHRPPGREEGV